jgi:hypothetical protein
MRRTLRTVRTPGPPGSRPPGRITSTTIWAVSTSRRVGWLSRKPVSASTLTPAFAA